MKPFYFEIHNKTDLYELNDGRFQLIKDGPLDPIMVGFKYILVKTDISEYFQSLGIERVTFEPTTLWNRKTDSEDFSYMKMIVNHHFSSSDLNDINLDGYQFLLMDNHYLFFTPLLKNTLEASNKGFVFSEGLSNFG